MVFRVLHLSDLHIGKTYKPSKEIVYKIVNDLEDHNLCTVDSIVITGDIFDGAQGFNDKLIDEAVSFFKTLLGLINSSKKGNKLLNKEDFIFVPGNHDLVRDYDENIYIKYQSFLEKFYGYLPSFYLNKFDVFKPYHNQKILFVGFNTCKIEKRNVFGNLCISRMEKHLNPHVLIQNGYDKSKLLEILNSEVYDDYFDMGYVSTEQMTELKKCTDGFKDFNIISLFHHHFYLFPEIFNEFGSTGFIQNYTEFSIFLQNLGVQTVLHGHKHFDFEKPYVTEKFYESPDSLINVFSGGSISISGKERHTFNVIDFYEKDTYPKLVQHKFVYFNESLSVQKTYIPPLFADDINLLNLLNQYDSSIYSGLSEIYESKADIHFPCKEIINWVEHLLSSFSESTYKITESPQNVLFLLYSIHLRCLNLQILIDKNNDFDAEMLKLNNLLSTQFSDSDQTFLEAYRSLFAISDLKKIADTARLLLKSEPNSSRSFLLSYSLLGIYFTDLYLILTKYADFFKHSIETKVNIRIEDDVFHKNVQLSRINVRSDVEKRSIYVELFCTEAIAHKMAVLFIKEFDILLGKYEDFFKEIGLKIYYVIPLIHKNNFSDQLDNYNFEAYIPTLLPLLTGDNIYPTKLVFSRELIQNSVDAIAVRENKSDEKFFKEIVVELGTDKLNRCFFRIIDKGSGMDRYKIERYFTSIGRSFYSDDDYEELGIHYKPISHFGIGFLSSFMVCKEVDVETKHYFEDSESLKLHIPNYDGCFFIETCSFELDIGTSITLYLNCDLKTEKIIEYLTRTILDLRYDLSIANLDDNIIVKIPAHSIRSPLNNFQFFIPFIENGDILKIKYDEVYSAIEKYNYGLLIKKHSSKTINPNLILNAGILIENASLNSLFYKNEDSNYKQSNFKGLNDENKAYNDIILNFPSNWIQIDVSRENINDFSNFITKLGKNSLSIGFSIAEALYSQISEFLEYSKTNIIDYPVIFVEEIIRYAISFCGSHNPYDSSCVYNNLLNLTYVVNIVFTENGILFEVVHASSHLDSKKDTLGVSYENDQAIIERDKRRATMLDFYIHKTISGNGLKNSFLRYVGRYFANKMISNPEVYDFMKRIILSNSGSGFNSRKLLEIAPIKGIENLEELDGMLENIALESLALSLLLLPNEITSKDPEDVSFIQLIEKTLMKRLTVSDIESGKNRILIKYDYLENYVKSSSIT